MATFTPRAAGPRPSQDRTANAASARSTGRAPAGAATSAPETISPTTPNEVVAWKQPRTSASLPRPLAPANHVDRHPRAV